MSGEPLLHSNLNLNSRQALWRDQSSFSLARCPSLQSRACFSLWKGKGRGKELLFQMQETQVH